MLYWGATAPLFYEKNSAFPSYPYQFDVSGYFSFIGVLHEHTHRAIEVDVHGYVKQYCRQKP